MKSILITPVLKNVYRPILLKSYMQFNYSCLWIGCFICLINILGFFFNFIFGDYSHNSVQTLLNLTDT